MRIRDLYESFNPNKFYLHGGPAELRGGKFMRYGKDGSDSGALFFIEESDTGYKYALGYAITKFKDGGVWRVKINIPRDKVFDFTNPIHKNIAKKNLSETHYQSWVNSSGKSGHLDWTALDDELLEEWGFEGIMLHERSAGFGQMTSHAISVGVFNPKYIEIVDFIPKKEALKLVA